MQKIERNKYFRNYRFIDNATSNKSKIDYIWMIKYWCLDDAAKRINEENALLAWIDLGFNHKNECYVRPEEFSFEWNSDVDLSKIHLFSLRPVDQFIGLETVQFLSDTIMGGFSLVPKALCNELWNMIKKSMELLLMLDCIDDDQQLLLMATRQRPDLFEIHISDWFLPLKECGAGHLTVRNKVEDKVTLKQLL